MRGAAAGLVALLVGLLLVLAPASPAAACSCAPELSTPAELVADEGTLAVFTGEVTGSDSDGMWVREIDFDVEEVWKGAVGATTTVKTHAQGPACGIDPAEGTHLLVFVYPASGVDRGMEEGEPVTGACGGTRSVDEAAALGPGRPPVEVPDEVFVDDGRDDEDLVGPVAGLVVGLVLVIGSVALLLRRARRSSPPADGATDA